MQIVDVIIDVPTLQTNTPFSYIWGNLVEQPLVGLRVMVPFGKSGRPVQGYVVSTNPDLTSVETTKLKKVFSVLDSEPVLNQELINLSSWVANETFSFRVSVLNAMLPNVLKLNTQRYIEIIDSNFSKEELLAVLTPEQVLNLHLTELTAKQQAQINQWVRNQKIQLRYQTDNTAHKKAVNILTINQTKSELSDLLSQIKLNAVKQRQLIQILLENKFGGEIEQVALMNQYNIGRSTIDSAVKKGWLLRTTREKYRNPFKKKVDRDQPLELNAEQLNAYQIISNGIEYQDPTPLLLQGVTGSGKTEVYLQSISKVLQLNKTALMLVPEISLTPLMVNRVRARFGSQVAVLHSGLSDGEKYDEWRRISRNEVKVVVGARSAVFAPLKNLGIIIVDEEHSSTYKQEDMPRYHARNVAIQRGLINHCPVILGSATPSLESRARATKGRYKFIELTKRANQQALPKIKTIDMRNEIIKNGNENFSKPMIEAIQHRLAAHEQVVLMLNRRGFSSFVMCRDCGFVLKCPNCDISLTMHVDTHSMRCHYCGHEEAIPNVCRNCGSKRIRFYGSGTQKVEQQLHELIPTARIIRMDVDTTRRKGAHERLLDKFGNHDADILLGTQMIAKGLDFPDVTLVGVLNADTSLELADFRASEHTFQLLTQVAGRAGRAQKKGEVLIQTFNPDHYAIKLVESQDYDDFYNKEMYLRHLSGYPPYYFTTQLTIANADEKVAIAKAYELLNQIQPQLSKNAVVLGPSPKSVARIKQKYLYQIIIKYQKEPNLKATLNQILIDSQAEFRHGTKITIDMEPQSFM